MRPLKSIRDKVRFNFGLPWIGLRCVGLLTLAFIPTSFATEPVPWEAALGIDPTTSYQATSQMSTPVGEFTMHERRAVGRSAVQMNVGGVASTFILREDKAVAYVLLPGMKMYREIPQQEGRTQTRQDVSYADVQKLGREAVAGHPATKYQASFNDDKGSGSGVVWVTDSGVMAKVDMQYGDGSAVGGNFRTEMIELEIGDQAASHFEIPKNYQPMNLAAVMGMFGAAGAQAQQAPVDPRPVEEPVANPLSTAGSATDSASDAAVANNNAGKQQSTIGGEITDAAQEVADGVKEEARSGFVENTRDRVRKGIRGLFRRKD